MWDSHAAEPECCDGSDEAPGVCPNVCKEVGEAYRERVKAEEKLRKTVSIPRRMRSGRFNTYIPTGFQDSFDIHRVRAEGEEAPRARDVGE